MLEEIGFWSEVVLSIFAVILIAAALQNWRAIVSRVVTWAKPDMPRFSRFQWIVLLAGLLIALRLFVPVTSCTARLDGTAVTTIVYIPGVWESGYMDEYWQRNETRGPTEPSGYYVRETACKGYRHTTQTATGATLLHVLGIAVLATIVLVVNQPRAK